MKKNLLTSLILGSILSSQTAFALEFSDVNKMHAHFVAIDYLSSENVLKGYDDGTFKPDQLVNRAEALKIIFGGLSVVLNSGVDLNKLFPDVKADDWFAPYVAQAKGQGIITGNADGTFAPERGVSRAEFIKMLLETIGFKKGAWLDQQIFDDVPKEAWFAPYLNYAGKNGLLSKDGENNLYPGKELTRAEVAEIVYLLKIIINSNNIIFLTAQANAQIAQIENYLGANNVAGADRAAKLAVDMTQQALKLQPDDNDDPAVFLGTAKIAKAYSLLVSSFIAALESRYTDARDLANQTLTKADEALQTNHDTETVVQHLKDKANEILTQIAGK